MEIDYYPSATGKSNIRPYVNLASNIGFSFSLIEKEQSLDEIDKKPILAAKYLLERIIWFEKNQKKVKEIGRSLDFLFDTNIFIESWFNSNVKCPNNDQEYWNKLEQYKNYLDNLTNSEKISDDEIFNELKKIFDTMWEINYRKVHHSSLYDLPH